MKKKMVALLAGAMMTLAAGNAFATFADLHLIRVAYQTTGGVTEVGTDLGDISTLLNAPSTTITANPFQLTDFAGGTLANINVGYFVSNVAAGTTSYFGGSANSALAPLKNGSLSAFEGAAAKVYLQYGAANSKSIGDKNATGSYYSVMDGGGAAPGYYSGAVTGNFAYGESSLANLATAGYLDMGLYSLVNNRTPQTGQQVATIRLNADGTTVVTSSVAPTPIPAAAWLMGSGLLGMVGIRRRSKKG